MPPAAESLLVGRDSELARLEAALGAVAAGAGGIVLLSGEPGIGKTRLAHELAARARARGALVAWGYCHEAEAAPPFWPWVQMLAGLVRTAEPDLVRAALGGGAAQIAQLVADVKDVPGVDLVPMPLMEPEAGRGLLFEAVDGFVRRLASAQPVVLVIDDLHSADVASLQLLQVVCAGIRATPVLVVCAYRQVEAQAAPPVVAALAHLGRQAGLVRIVPRGLNEPEVAALVEDATGRPPRSGLAHAIRARTEGNPFFVSELVALLGSRGQGEGADAEPVDRDIPAGVRDAIRARLSRLPEEGVALLGVAAVIGREFDLGLLAASADVDVERALDLLELALVLGVVTESVELPGGFRFSHGLVRETLYDGLPNLRRARLHRRVGEALERLRPDDPPLDDLAHHYLEGVPAGTVDKAIFYALRLAGQATTGFAFELAEEQLARALTLLSSIPASAARSERELDVQVQLGSVLAIRQGYAAPDVGKALARAGELSRQVGDSARLLGSLRGAFIFALVGVDLDNAGQIGRQLLELGEATGDPAFLAAGHRAAGTVAFSLGRLAESRRRLELGIALADTLDGSSLANVTNDPSIGGRNKLAQTLWLLGDVEASDRVAEEALARARRAGAVSLVDTLFMEGIRHAFSGDDTAVLECAEEALALASAHGFPLYDGSTRVLRGWARVARDGSTDAVGEIETALASVRSTGARMYCHFFSGLLADARMRVGRHDDALEAVDEGLADVGAGGERFWEAELMRLRGVILASGGGREDDAEDSLLRAAEVARSQQARGLESRAAASLAQARRVWGTGAGRDGRPDAEAAGR